VPASLIPGRAAALASPKKWVLPARGLAVYYGCPETLRLFHYFLPAAILTGRRLLCLDGGNRFDPLLLARMARQRRIETALFNQHVRVARAFTCFQLTELLARVARPTAATRNFRADTLLVTALPDLYFDEDVRDVPARASFSHALQELRRLRLQFGVAVFSDAPSFTTARQRFFPALLSVADYIWKFTPEQDGGVQLACEKSSAALPAAG